MREDLLHFIWRHNKLPTNQLCTTDDEPVLVKSIGIQNRHAGPDFFNASVTIDGQLWAGNVEMHLKSSDWYAHHHEIDKNYDNVILHVVWEDDVVVFRKDGSKIPTLEMRNFIPSGSNRSSGSKQAATFRFGYASNVFSATRACIS